VSERLCVCGLGKVGRPILNMLRKKGFEAVGHDREASISEVSVERAVAKSDACIFIVQTPSLLDGSFDNSFLIDALCRFSIYVRAARRTDYLYIITSTTVPGSCDEFRKIVGDNIVYKPEFIRLEHVDEDLLDPAFILIGEGCKEAGDRTEALYRSIYGYELESAIPMQYEIPVKRMSLLEAELAKITLNCALTMKISLANQLHLVAKKLGADSKRIMEAVGSDPRIGPDYLTPGWPYSGPCLPRDNRMMQFVAEKVGVDAALSKAADRINGMIHASD
jgi:UDPglucose 6-dehydrogenase